MNDHRVEIVMDVKSGESLSRKLKRQGFQTKRGRIETASGIKLPKGKTALRVQVSKGLMDTLWKIINRDKKFPGGY